MQREHSNAVTLWWFISSSCLLAYALRLCYINMKPQDKKEKNYSFLEAFLVCQAVLILEMG